MNSDHDLLSTSPLSAENLSHFFISHLNRIYCAKSHLQERLPEIRTHAHFTDLFGAISESIADVERQIARMDSIYQLLNAEPNFENCKDMIGLIENAFNVIFEDSENPVTRDLSILFYLQQIESIEMAAYRLLNMVAPLTNRKEIVKLLNENFDDAKEDLVLFQNITGIYFRK